MVKICICGNEVETHGLSDYNRVVMCEDCQEKRIRVIKDIEDATYGIDVAVVRVARSLAYLIEYSAFPFDITYVRDAKMEGREFEVVEAEECEEAWGWLEHVMEDAEYMK